MTRTKTHRGTEYAVSEAHPAAEVFPWLSADDLDALATDIEEHGLRYKVRRQSQTGLVFDGRNRELACRIAGVEPEYVDEELDDAEVVAFVKSANMRRRDLTLEQRAAAAVALAKLTGAKTTEVAEQFGVSERTVRYAAAVQRTAPEVFSLVQAGDMPVRTAVKVASLPAEKRAEIVAAPMPAEAAREALEEAESEEEPVEPEEVLDEGSDSAEEPAPVPGEQDANEPEGEVPEQSFDEWHASLPKRDRNKLKPGNNVDPDHPFARTLKAMTALVKAFNEDMAADETGMLKDNLFEFAKMNAPLKQVVYVNGYHDPDNKFHAPRTKYVGLAHLRAVVRDTGKRRKRMTRRQLEQLIDRVNGASDQELLDREDTE